MKHPGYNMTATHSDPPTAMPGEEEIRNALRHVMDPEVGVNIVDLGLVYRIAIHERHVRIEMTMTSQACPLGDVVIDDAYGAAGAVLPEDATLDIELVWEPPWVPEMMSEHARQTLGWKKP